MNPMNWDAIGAVGEILGASAVVISLVYLAAQIRAQNREARAAAMHEISEGFRDSIATFVNRENAEIITRANRDFDALPDEDVFVLLAGLQRFLRLWEEAFHQYNDGRLDSKIWNVMVKQYASFISMPAMNRIWQLRKDYYDPEFREFVENLAKTEYKIR